MLNVDEWSITVEKKKLVSLVVITLVAFAMGGCGRIYSGSYPGTATMTLNGVATVPSQVTITLNQAQGDTVTGTVSSTTFGTGNLTGRASPNGNGIDNVMLTLSSMGAGLSNPTGYPQTGYPTGYPTTGYPTGYPSGMTPGMGMTGMCTTFIGNLSISPSKTLTGTLAAQPPCSGSINFNGQGY
jgi:hypothetical protein